MVFLTEPAAKLNIKALGEFAFIKIKRFVRSKCCEIIPVHHDMDVPCRVVNTARGCAALLDARISE